MSSSESTKSPVSPASSPGTPRLSPGKLRVFFQDIQTSSRHKLNHFFGSCTYRRRRKSSGQEAIPILLDEETKEYCYGATGPHINQAFKVSTPESATRNKTS